MANSTTVQGNERDVLSKRREATVPHVLEGIVVSARPEVKERHQNSSALLLTSAHRPDFVDFYGYCFDY